MVRRSRAVAAVVVASAASVYGCSKPARTSKLIDDYSNAECISPLAEITPGGSNRAWREVLRLHDGLGVTVVGVRAPGGRISVRYNDVAVPVTAADAGDYVYPADVRWNPEREILYVKAVGVAPVPWDNQRTVLFEYDVRAGRPILQQRVEPTVLPPECAARRTK